MKRFNIKNIRRGWKTTLFAVLLTVAAVTLVYLEKAAWGEISPVLLIVVPFLLYGDEDTNHSDNGGAAA